MAIQSDSCAAPVDAEPIRQRKLCTDKFLCESGKYPLAGYVVAEKTRLRIPAAHFSPLSVVLAATPCVTCCPKSGFLWTMEGTPRKRISPHAVWNVHTLSYRRENTRAGFAICSMFRTIGEVLDFDQLCALENANDARSRDKLTSSIS